jgi:hypothetical protein
MNESRDNERRDASAVGKLNRAQFDASATLLHHLGLSADAVAHIERRARIARRLPHELLVEIVDAAVQDAEP